MDSGIVLAAFGCWVLAAFGGGELLAVAIPTLRPLVFLLYLACPCLCNDDIKYEHAHNRLTFNIIITYTRASQREDKDKRY